ncbi:MAG: Flp pilus assembly protein CpaB [bacterium]|nr:Flp pilus assembly protein CpaB [bacterium]
MNVRRTTLIVAVVLAIGAGWLTLSYLSALKSQSQAAGAPRQVIVAATEIPARAPITLAMLARVTRPASAVDPDAITDPKTIVGSLSLITIPAGATITASKIGRPANAALPVRLQPGMRAISIQVDKVKSVSGLLQPGDRVDVIAVPPKSTNQPPPAATILRGVRVLAMGDTLEYSSATPSPDEANSTTITLEVTPSQADLLAMADVNTTLRLALRSPREKLSSLPPETLRFPQSDTVGPAPAVAQAPASAAVASSRVEHPRESSVPVIDGSQGDRP